MQTDLEIAKQKSLKPIEKIIQTLNVRDDEYEFYGKFKAKIEAQRVLSRLHQQPDGHLILVTAINPTPAGEGKTTTSIGLADALNQLGEQTVLALREPSLGPVFGLKGGATGGGYAQVAPMTDINLHFTGDLHAIGAANNLCAACIDNHLHQGNTLQIDPKRIIWKRCIDLNDRALRQVIIGLGDPANGVMREDQFQITVASEVMAILCLAQSFEDLKQRLNRTIIAYSTTNQPITIGDLGIVGAMATLLKDAFKPNLVQTLEGTPALIHGGPFANIAHGCNSIQATRLALKLGKYVVTEAGFGADLGAEKFLDIKCRLNHLTPKAAVLVATVRALKFNGGCPLDKLHVQNLDALQKGLPNLLRHIENLTQFNLPVVVSLNQFPTDHPAEIELIREACTSQGVPCCLSEVYTKGGSGGLALAKTVIQSIAKNPQKQLVFPYELTDPLADKIRKIATTLYRANDVQFSDRAIQTLQQISQTDYAKLPICMAKTPFSFTDDPSKLGAPTDFTIQIRDIKCASGAGFIICLAGNILTMPGLPKDPAALRIDVENNDIIGLS